MNFIHKTLSVRKHFSTVLREEIRTAETSNDKT